TVSQGHPDYRFIEQEKYRLVKERFPLIASYMLVDTSDYSIARRGTEERIQEKEKRIMEQLRRREEEPSPGPLGIWLWARSMTAAFSQEWMIHPCGKARGHRPCPQPDVQRAA